MKQASESSHERGLLGEQRAVDYLTNAGYCIRERNFRTRRGEVDIIASEGRTLVFVEVKCWKTIDFADLGVSVGKRKQRRIIEASRVYLARQEASNHTRVRFDVIFIQGETMEVHHVREAFTESTWSG